RARGHVRYHGEPGHERRDGAVRAAHDPAPAPRGRPHRFRSRRRKPMKHAVVRLAVLGDPLRYTRSPDLHRAGAEAVGLACESEALRTAAAELPATLERLAASGYMGCNLTMPLKEPALACLRTVSATARRARSVNTVTFRADGAHGESTDGAGFLDLLASLDRKASGARVV